jgi:hypothetical protein
VQARIAPLKSLQEVAALKKTAEPLRTPPFPARALIHADKVTARQLHRSVRPLGPRSRA